MKQLDATKVALLRAAFKDVVQDIRQSFQDADIAAFCVEIEAKGRTFNGEAKLTCTVASSEYGSNAVSSPDLRAAHVECLRRHGFDVVNEALALPAPGTQLEDEIPF